MSREENRFEIFFFPRSVSISIWITRFWTRKKINFGVFYSRFELSTNESRGEGEKKVFQLKDERKVKNKKKFEIN